MPLHIVVPSIVVYYPLQIKVKTTWLTRIKNIFTTDIFTEKVLLLLFLLYNFIMSLILKFSYTSYHLYMIIII